MPAAELDRSAVLRRRPLAAAAVRTAAGLVATLTLAACGDPRPPAATLRPAPPTEAAGALGAGATIVEPSRVRHEGILVPAGEAFSWSLPGPASGRLRFAWAAQTPGAATLTVEIAGVPPSPEMPAIQRTFDARAGLAYEDMAIATDAPAALTFVSDAPAGVVISDLRIVQPSPHNDALIVLLLDTTRRDAIGLYGSRRPTTPHLDRIFADAWKAERAWAPASWTTPSVAALLTGMVPASQEDASGASVGIAPDLETLGHDFTRAGWSTAHFNANPALNVENGFHRGFTTFYTPPYEMSSMALPGSAMLSLLPEWLRAHDGERFLLYLQLIEPHEPYGRPDRPRGETDFDPDYSGRFAGHESHYDLSFDAAIEPRDVEHLRALYDDDVRYADLLIGRFWDGFDEAMRDRATVVFLSDHGEEFLEHGGWKHGPSLYDEVLRVPFLLRSGNGRKLPPVPPEALVSLTDFLPTIERHLGIPRLREVDGVDLLDPSSWTRQALPPIHMLTGGAARAVVVRQDRKLHFFDRLGTRGLPDAARDPLGHRVALHLRSFLPALGWYDLDHDPGERALLAPPLPAMDPDWRAIELSLAHTRSGLELRVLGGAAVAKAQFTISAEGGSEPAAERFALEAEDAVASALPSEPRTVHLDLELTPGDVDGLLLQDSDALRARLTVTGGCLRWNGERLTPGTTREIGTIPEGVPRFAIDPDCPALFIWRTRDLRPARNPQDEDEERQKLRALGYIH